jgi:uncharacterized protein YciI
MPYFALQYQVVDDFANKRTPFRPAHLKEVREAHDRGEIVMAGALADPSEALIIFRSADRSTAENFAKNDPYVKGGLVNRWTVRQWTVVVGQDPSETPPGLPPQ